MVEIKLSFVVQYRGKYKTFCRYDTCVDYVTYAPKIENNTIKIGHFIYKCKISTFVILDGCRRKIHRNCIKVIISLNL